MYRYNSKLLAAVLQTVDKKDARPFLRGVHIDGGYAVASNGRTMTVAYDDIAEKTNPKSEILASGCHMAEGISALSIPSKLTTEMKKYSEPVLIEKVQNDDAAYVAKLREKEFEGIHGTGSIYPLWRNLLVDVEFCPLDDLEKKLISSSSLSAVSETSKILGREGSVSFSGIRHKGNEKQDLYEIILARYYPKYAYLDDSGSKIFSFFAPMRNEEMKTDIPFPLERDPMKAEDE